MLCVSGRQLEAYVDALKAQWDALDKQRAGLQARHNPDGGTFFEEEEWAPEYDAIIYVMDAIVEELDKHEEQVAYVD